MQGASALTKVLATQKDPRLKVFVVWERVLSSDIAAPGTGILSLSPDARTSQYWDPARLLSHALGEREGEKRSIIWDWIALYPPGVTWEETAPPVMVFVDRPVVQAVQGLRKKLAEELKSGG